MRAPEPTAAELHPHEQEVLRAFGDRLSQDPGGSLLESTLLMHCRKRRLEDAQTRRAVELLKLRGAITAQVSEQRTEVNMTELGRRYAQETPEEQLLATLKSAQHPMEIDRLRQCSTFSPKESGTALGILKKTCALRTVEGGLIEIDPAANLEPVRRIGELLKKTLLLIEKGDVHLDRETFTPAEQEEIRKGYHKRGVEKGLFRLNEVCSYIYQLTPTGRLLLKTLTSQTQQKETEEITRLTPELLRSGEWKGRSFRKFNLHLPPPRQPQGRRHPYLAFLDGVKQKLVGLGFEELTGPLVVPEFWNMDALFMPQFHPARAIHDVYFVREPSEACDLDPELVERVARAHENGGDTGSRGWGYPFDRKRTRRHILRSQGTAISARCLAQNPRIPGKYFAVARCFRYDTVDATHAADFFQIEGIAMDRQIHFRHLLGLLKLFAVEIARAPEVAYRPAYFPFTEPSVEVHIRHPELGWMELGGAGIFRPEVTRPLGVEAPVIAWGLGLDRMAMVALGIRDIRDLFSEDLELVRSRKLPF
jgi:phenylalanyl-tRNA synthetase alpha chain